MSEVNSSGEDRIDKIERDLKALKSNVDVISSELAKTVKDLKDAILKVRTALNEIDNPFNLLRAMTGGNSVGRRELTPKTKRVPSRLKWPNQEAISERVKYPAGEEEAGEPEEVLPEAVSKERIPSISFKQGASFIRWIYMMLDLGFDGDSIQKITEYCEALGVVPQCSSAYVPNLIDVIVRARTQGLSENEIILSIYGAAEAVGIKVDYEEICQIALQVLKRNRVLEKVAR